MVGIDFLLLTAAVVILLLAEGSDLRQLEQNILGRIEGAVVRRISDGDFYREFMAACKAAKYSVSISYFSALPPDRAARDYQDSYYKEHLATVKKSPHITYKRIVRDSPENRPWIKKLMDDLQGKSNAYLAVLTDLDPIHEMPLALSVQIVDDDRVWLVALKSHLPDGKFRDLYIESRDVAQAMTEYYERLWTTSKIVLKAGEVTSDGTALADQTA
jgi:hypothetical protein